MKLFKDLVNILISIIILKNYHYPKLMGRKTKKNNCNISGLKIFRLCCSGFRCSWCWIFRGFSGCYRSNECNNIDCWCRSSVRTSSGSSHRFPRQLPCRPYRRMGILVRLVHRKRCSRILRGTHSCLCKEVR